LAIASDRYTVGGVQNPAEVAAALRQIGRGFAALADAIDGTSAQPPERVRAASLLREWGDRGLSRAEASALFRKHGFAPQTAGGWARSDWIQTRPDGRRYVTDGSRQWLAGQEGADD
jgi:hypothetical protein